MEPQILTQLKALGLTQAQCERSCHERQTSVHHLGMCQNPSLMAQSFFLLTIAVTRS
jgi:hypothetical protein